MLNFISDQTEQRGPEDSNLGRGRKVERGRKRAFEDSREKKKFGIVSELFAAAGFWNQMISEIRHILFDRVRCLSLR